MQGDAVVFAFVSFHFNKKKCCDRYGRPQASPTEAAAMCICVCVCVKQSGGREACPAPVVTTSAVLFVCLPSLTLALDLLVGVVAADVV